MSSLKDKKNKSLSSKSKKIKPTKTKSKSKIKNDIILDKDAIYKRRTRKKFWLVFISMMLVYVIIFTGVSVWAYTSGDLPSYDQKKQRDITVVGEEELAQEKEVSGGFLSNILVTPVRTNFLLVGVDKGEALTDTIMVGSFVSTNGETKILSIPRDTYISASGNKLKEYRELAKGLPSVFKINSANSYGGKTNGIILLKKVLEDMLGIKIDYYAKVDVASFRSVVDTIGGVWFDVPQRMKYTDPVQNLKIDLQPGKQLLDGKSAEGLVRFRKGYAQQDLRRVEVQQEFIKEFVKQVLTKENLIKNAGGLAIDFLKYVDTDFGIENLPKYLPALPKISGEKIESDTLPGYPQTIDGASYYISDNSKVNEIVKDFFYGSTLEKTSEISENEYQYEEDL